MRCPPPCHCPPTRSMPICHGLAIGTVGIEEVAGERAPFLFCICEAMRLHLFGDSLRTNCIRCNKSEA